MNTRSITLTLCAAALFALASTPSHAQVTYVLGESEGVVVNVGGASPWGYGSQTPQFDSFMWTLTQMNMTPDFTLDAAAKKKLGEVREEWTKAQAKFMEEKKEEFKQISQKLSEASQAKDQEKIKALSKSYQDLYATGPKHETYIAKAKAALAPDQLQAVEEKIKKDQEAQKAMLEQWRKHEAQEHKDNKVKGAE